MKIAVLSHSLIHDRQRLFFDYMNRSDVQVLQVYPRSWGQLKRAGGFSVNCEGDMWHYTFPPEAFERIRQFKADLIYYQGEWWSAQAKVSLEWAKQLHTKFAIFCWENIRQVESDEHKEILRNADVVVCGNWDARAIVKPYAKQAVRIPQVGLDTDVFKPVNVEKKFDLLFKGRLTDEKGVVYIMRAAEGLGLTLCLGEEYVAYSELPKVYSSARVFIQFPYAVPEWKEQLNYAICEALSCCLPVVTSTCGSIPEWYDQAPMVIFVNEKDEPGLQRRLKNIFSNPIPKNETGREWVKHTLSKEVITQQLMEVFERL